MNIPSHYSYSVIATLIMTIVAYFAFPEEILIATGVFLGGVVSPLFTQLKSSAKSAARLAQSAGYGRQQAGVPSDVDHAELLGEIKTIYVGNLPYRANESAIKKLFSDYGLVLSVRLVKDRDTGKRKGYGFVEMPTDAAAKAIEALNETEYLQRTLKVREANEKKDTGRDDEDEQSSVVSL
jgi:RNA recognition motif-containing protein